MKLTSQIICEIIKNGMGLDSDQIWIYNQRRSIPEDEKLYITVGMSAMKPYGNNRSNRSADDGSYSENLSQYIQEMISIDVMSDTTEAQERYHEVLGALVSSFSQEIQKTYALKISEMPTTIVDVSEIDGATILNRLSITLNVLRKYDMLMGAAYYDSFSKVSKPLVDK